MTGDRLQAFVGDAPKEHIVLAFHHPDQRKYTGFAVA